MKKVVVFALVSGVTAAAIVMAGLVVTTFATGAYILNHHALE